MRLVCRWWEFSKIKFHVNGFQSTSIINDADLYFMQFKVSLQLKPAVVTLALISQKTNIIINGATLGVILANCAINIFTERKRMCDLPASSWFLQFQH